MEKIASIAAALIGVAMVAVLVQSPNTSKVVMSTGVAFGSAVKAAQGR